MDERTEIFHYTALKNPHEDLRLFVLEQPTKDENGNQLLRGTLQTYTPLERNRDGYQALSYTWGDSVTRIPILLNEKTFLITANLECCLRNLCHATILSNPIPIWIDAICINQEHPEERDSQVRRMKSIYQNAAQVIIWLGDYQEPGDNALNPQFWGVDQLEVCDSNTATKVMLSLLSCNNSNSYYHDQIWTQLCRIFHRPWFERLWIIQELGVSQKAMVLWGQTFIAWELLESAAHYILRPGSNPPPSNILRLFPHIGAHRVSQVALRSMLNVDFKNILTILHNTQAAKCMDPRDRLFAILAVVNYERDVDIDYSIPVQEVYRNWAVKRIRRTNTLDVLSACADSGRAGDLPSWVPDLRRTWGQDKLLWIHTHVMKRDALGTSRYTEYPNNYKCQDLSFSNNSMRLTVRGKSCRTITALSPLSDAINGLEDPTDLTERFLQIIRTWQHWGEEQFVHQPFDAQRKIEETFLRASLSLPYTSKSEVCYDYYSWRVKCTELQNFGEKNEAWVKCKVSMKDFERTLFPRLHDFQLFITSKFHIGIVAGNSKVQIGDELWILDGGFTPFILRPKTLQTKSLISPCYVRNYMSAFGSELIDSTWGKNGSEYVTLE